MDEQRLVSMANQIARNLAAQGEDAAVSAMVQHIVDFWDPRMKAAILLADPQGLDPITATAISRLGVDCEAALEWDPL
ncbi:MULTISPECIES: formate dehydrogenase subunit delta [Sphingomonadaceae]|jgi:formate dehydrogenase subunit delta|uniref:NADH-dependent formate dehydrogenase delta subunit FdsD n=1 Tax=Edaphosphingomonas haloaromaticamans TaxID=653954 RepID=A0A1S1H8K7_9SPHN|nr:MULTISPECIES: formate dehydrogenase subunit delta [Sphingomonadaceae]OHT17771.1 NADH-dependent formate dehydrogenase delta subunit FdsD [Sphingomonas haloaromaticamans]